jgi:hypothetical protein
MKKRLRKPSPALAISLIALFVALGGTSYAATRLPKNSVGTKQLKNNAVTGAKIAGGAVTAAKINPSGLTVPNAAHATSADSATAATNATTAANATNASALGGHSASFFAPATLPSGHSESGTWLIDSGDTGAFAGDAITFPTPLAAGLAADRVEYIGTTTSTECPGIGHAATGWLCIYASHAENLAIELVTNHDETSGSDAYGFLMEALVDASPGRAWGSWTVTAP